jgi:hypothetical protein
MIHPEDHPNDDPSAKAAYAATEYKSVMACGQYFGWLHESWIDANTKHAMMGGSTGTAALGAETTSAADVALHHHSDVFSAFTVLPDDPTPQLGERVRLFFKWPEGVCDVVAGTVRIQTDIFAAWVEVAKLTPGTPPQAVAIGPFDRATPVSYRVDVTLADGEEAELWGYFQVRATREEHVLPAEWSRLDLGCAHAPSPLLVPRTVTAPLPPQVGYSEPSGWHIDVLASCNPMPTSG